MTSGGIYLPETAKEKPQQGLVVAIGETTYRDGLDLQPSQLFALVQQTGELPKTSAASVADFTA